MIRNEFFYGKSLHSVNKKYLFLPIILVAITLLGVEVRGEIPNDPQVDVRGDNRSLEEIVSEITKQTGYTIQISEGLLQRKVNGVYRGVDIDTFFKRILRDQNVMQVFDPQEHTLKVVTIDKTPTRVFTFQKTPSGVVVNNLDGEPDKTLEDLLDERNEVLADTEPQLQPLDGESEKTFQDLQKEREDELKSFNPEELVLDGSGKTVQELRSERDTAMRTQGDESLVLDGEQSRTVEDLAEERKAVRESYDLQSADLDGEPGKTLADLYTEREEWYRKNKNK